MTWREYHEATKHTEQSLRRAQYTLDWANMPDPFRHYEGVPVLDLPADPPVPEIPALEVLQGGSGHSTPADGATFLSELLFHSAAISATKEVPSTGYRYALRVNPSSGNLHPTEFHFITRGLREWPDGLYHYRPSSHMAEQRASGFLDLNLAHGQAPLVFVLTSIAWREAWKYRDRAYRYCLHDIGHAWQSLHWAARAMGCRTIASGVFADEEVSHFCRVSDDEWPMLVVAVYPTIPTDAFDAKEIVRFGGEPNQLSTRQIAYPSIDAIHSATKITRPFDNPVVQPATKGSGSVQLPTPASSGRTFGNVVRRRRSALDFVGGSSSISLEQLSAILASASGRFIADFASQSRFIQLYLYAHRVSGLAPGVYRYWPEQAQLELIRSGDQRVAAAGLSLGQDLAGNACVAFSMVADLERATASYGDRGYRYVHFEAGAIGQCLYLSAEALGLGATGIGAFFDDKVHAYLNITSHHLTPQQGQVIYHFAIGYPVPDSRLSS